MALTRAPERARAYVDALVPHRATVMAVALTEVLPATAAESEALTLALRTPCDAIVLSSAAAVPGLIAALGDAPVPAPVWAVGPATHAALAAHGIVASQPERASATGLLAAIGPAKPRRVVVPRAESGREELINGLRQAGVEVADLVAYRSVPRAIDNEIRSLVTALTDGSLDAIVAFAPSHVAALAAAMRALGHSVEAPSAVLVAIGDTTADAWRAHFARVDAIASEPTPTAVADALIAALPAPGPPLYQGPS